MQERSTESSGSGNRSRTCNRDATTKTAAQPGMLKYLLPVTYPDFSYSDDRMRAWLSEMKRCDAKSAGLGGEEGEREVTTAEERS
jgi:hypothetical protein